jgi:subtilisin family serine protease
MSALIGRGTTIAAFLRSLLTVVVFATAASAQPGPPPGSPRWLAPAEPAVRPALPARSDFDLDNNRIDDRLDRSIGALRRELARERVAAKREELAARLAADVEIEVVFSEQVTQPQIDAFASLGGKIGHLFRNVSFGWTGTLPAASLDALPAVLGPSLLVVAGDTPARLHMDEATRSGRVRPVWASGFAGQPSGISGTTNITVGIVDSGVDDSHTDLSGRMAFWHDYSTDAAANPVDIISHGSHVAGIAVGSGASFGVGPGTLKFTDGGNLASVAASQFFLNGVHYPPEFMTAEMSAAWIGGGETLLRIASRTNGVGGGFISICNSATKTSPIALTCQTQGNTTQIYSTALPQSSNTSIDQYATTVSLSPYRAVGDGFNAMRGVAPGARWAGAKAFTNAGSGGSLTIGAAVDGLVAQRTTHNVKVINLSLGLNGAPGVDTALRAKINSAVSNGIVVVAAAGNDGPGSAASNVVDDPGRAALALTVGATNDVNALTRYSSAGFASPASDEDNKPDLVAPGGSDFYSKILAVDSNDSDADSSAMADRQANDYASKKGTSMAAPFAAGSAALVIDAMQKAGATWNFNSGAQPLFVKMLLCASSTETNAVRENAAGSNPTLGRAATPKDIFEGYGLINADAAVEAISTLYSGGSLGGSSEGGTFDRRAWGRKLGITSGGATQLTLTVPAEADYDLYLYSGNPDAKGNPVIVASSTNAGAGADETLSFTPTTSETRYLFVKRVSGGGDWSLASGAAQSFCGDGQKTGAEQCDDGNQLGGDCCSASCQYEASNSPCNDGLFCTSTDRCNTTGVCLGSGNPCSTGPECNNTCSEANDNCFAPAGTACTADASVCTLDQCNGSGSCAHPAGNGGATCRAASGICDVAETCTGSAVACPADGYAGTSKTCRDSTSVCDPAEVCAGTGPSCPANTFASGAVTCRLSTGVCDPAESCTGTSAACPGNTFSSSTTPCRGSASVCDAVETCTGTSGACPADAFSASTTVCRAASGACDAAERCTGAGGSCPADAFADESKVCRTAAGVCDAEETCTGTSDACPTNGYAGREKTCRAAASICDFAEVCTGEGANCPIDGVAEAGALCRPANGNCDAEERCDGESGACPADQFAATTTVCRTASGVCDAAERCTGTSAACPANGFEPTTTLCRSAGGVCDSGEHCPGNSASCPADTLADANTVCRPAAGGCDAPELCTGLLPLCPIDLYKLTLTPCRAAAGSCDAVEVCSGLSASCPADEFASGGTCRASNGVCDQAETCTGNSAGCPADGFLGTTTTCRGAASVCDAAERCSGSAASCPADAFAASTTTCRAASGVCDVAETCTGTSATCAGDGVASASTPCRESAGECDLAETCSGAGKSCPADERKAADTSCASDGLPCTEDVCNGTSASCQHTAGNAGAVCRSAASVCDVAESCSGTSTSCPASGFAATTVTCRSASGVCDLAERCTGTTGTCPNDAVATSAVTCRAGAGVCDVAETCNGTAKTCPANSLAADDTSCTTDNNDCTNDVCNGVSAECQHEANSAPCNDGVFCNGNDTCAATVCSQHAGNPCAGADGDADCTESCDETADTCGASDPNGSSCNDGVACTTGETCQAGVCTQEANTCGECGDGHTDTGEECDDGNLSNGDCCSSSCRISGGNGACDDGVFCNGPDHCQAGACSDHDGDPCPGPDGDGNCSETCDEAADACTAPDPNGSSCSDAAFCNGADTCSGGVCSFHSGDPCPGADGDGNCAESCSEPADSCTASDFAGSGCDDGDPCTVNEQCGAGTCNGEPSDEPECTTTTTVEAVMCGDASGDGKLSAGDAQIALRTAVGTTDCSLEACDYSGDGRVTATDANFILRVAVGQDVEAKCPSGSAALAASTTSTTLE